MEGGAPAPVEFLIRIGSATNVLLRTTYLWWLVVGWLGIVKTWLGFPSSSLSWKIKRSNWVRLQWKSTEEPSGVLSLLREVGGFCTWSLFRVSISSKVGNHSLHLPSQEPKVYTYEYLPIFRTITEMIPPKTAMPSKTPTMIPTRVPTDKPPEWDRRKKAESPDEQYSSNKPRHRPTVDNKGCSTLFVLYLSSRRWLRRGEKLGLI